MQAKRQMGKGATARTTRRVGRGESRPYEDDQGLVVRTTLQGWGRWGQTGKEANGQRRRERVW